jgi:hypothetical protein
MVVVLGTLFDAVFAHLAPRRPCDRQPLFLDSCSQRGQSLLLSLKLISDCLIPLNVEGDPVKLSSPGISYIITCEGHPDPSELNEGSSKLSKRDAS